MTGRFLLVLIDAFPTNASSANGFLVCKCASLILIFSQLSHPEHRYIHSAHTGSLASCSVLQKTVQYCTLSRFCKKLVSIERKPIASNNLKPEFCFLTTLQEVHKHISNDILITDA